MKKIVLLLIAAAVLLCTACTAVSVVPNVQDPASVPAENTAEPTVAPEDGDSALPEDGNSKVPEITPMPEEAAPTKENASPYDAVLQQYTTAILEAWDIQALLEAGLSESVAENRGFMGYLLQDANADGIPELIVGSTAEGDNRVFGMYTLIDDKVQAIFIGNPRDSYVLYTDEAAPGCLYIWNTGSDGAARTLYFSSTVDNGALRLIQGIIYDATVDTENPYFSVFDYDLSDPQPMDTDIAEAVIADHDASAAHLPFISFGA